MVWFALFACTVFGIYFWREYRVQQQDLQSASSPHRTGERYIGQVLTLTDGLRDGRPGRPGRHASARHGRGRGGADRRPPAGLSAPETGHAGRPKRPAGAPRVPDRSRA